MGRPTTRKEWLETFLRLADSGASALDYRRELGIRAQDLPAHVKSLGKYRSELNRLKVEEEQAKERAAAMKRAEEQRKREKDVRQSKETKTDSRDESKRHSRSPKRRSADRAPSVGDTESSSEQREL